MFLADTWELELFFTGVFDNNKKLDEYKKRNKNLSKALHFLQLLRSKKKLQKKNQKEIALMVGEIIKMIGKNRFIIKSATGTKYITSSQVFQKKKKEESMRIGFDTSTFGIMALLSVNFDPILEKMVDKSNELISYDNVGGLDLQIQNIREVIEFSMNDPEILSRIGFKVMKGVLLYGPPGTGKTLLAKSLSSNIKSTFIKMVGSEIVDKYIGESARIVREIFNFAKKNKPSIIFIDEIDAIGGRRLSDGNASDREVQRVLIELLNQLDGFEELLSVKVIMATNRPDILDPALMRPGRIDRKLKIDLPDQRGRLQIFKIYFKLMHHLIGIDFEKIIKMCVGFSGSDIRNLVTEAGISANRANKSYVREEDLLKAYQKVRRSKF